MNDKIQLDLTLIPKELKLLLELIKDDNDKNIQQHKEKLFMDIDWDYFLKLAMHHRIYPLAYLRLKEVAIELTPTHVLHSLEAEYKKNTFKMLHLSGEMEKISKIFSESQVKSLFLKGPVIAYDLYGDISLRTSKDLDILVEETDLLKVENLLLGEGYNKEIVPTVLNEGKWLHHHMSYYHPQKRIQIEIHWRLHPRPIKGQPFNELWKRKRKSSLTGYPVHFLGEEDLILFLVVHGARHGWFRLRWLNDLNHILKKEVNLNNLNKLLNNYQASHLWKQTLALNSLLFSSNTTREVELSKMNFLTHRIVEKALSYILAGGEVSFKTHIAYLFLITPHSRKLELAFINIFYPRFKNIKVLLLPRRLHFLYFFIHPLLWIIRKKRIH